ncbi:MAG: SDR family oxidoreductase, partial [Burkholderiaceae bacterium]
MSHRLAGKTAFLTAAAHGIGRATALAFTREGARVIATDVDAAGLATLARECGCEVHRLDATDGAAITALAREVGTIQILFNAAGIVHAGSVLDATEADWDLAFDLNARSMARTIRAFLPGMLAQGAGAIVNIASVASSVRGVPN